MNRVNTKEEQSWFGECKTQVYQLVLSRISRKNNVVKN